MDRDLSQITVARLIVHDVPVHRVGQEGPKPELSNAESTLNPRIRNYFQRKIVTSLKAAAVDVCFDPVATSPVPGLVTTHLTADGGDFVQMSCRIAEHLYAQQTGANSPGLLFVIEARLGDARSLVILKLEREEGIRAHIEQHGGIRSFSIEQLTDLMLTNKTKVFKVGLFLHPGDDDGAIEGAVSDQQRGFHPSTEVADFFLTRFLGCKLREVPEILTKRFYQAAEDFINETVTDPSTKARYQIGLLAAMNRQGHMLSPWGFAEETLDLEHRDPFIQNLQAQHLPTQQFDKDISRIESRLKKIQMDFSSGLALLGSTAAFDEHVDIQEGDGRTTVTVTDQIKRVHSK